VRRWVDLYREHSALRDAGREVVTEIRRELARISEAHPDLFNPYVPTRLVSRTNGEITEVNLNGDEGEYILLEALPAGDRSRLGLKEAHLKVRLLLRNKVRLLALVLMVEATTEENAPWTVAVHLPDEGGRDGGRQGLGACSHAALHCHIGPTLDAFPEVRVPLPPLGPGDLVSWVLSQIIPTEACEPAPWARVLEALNPSGT
jgi:hypothetical protein